jgi:DNA polymerase-1
MGIRSSKFGMNVKMILQVHDELVVEVKNGLEKEVGALLQETMENVVQLKVPVRVDLKTGHNWGEMEKKGGGVA